MKTLKQLGISPAPWQQGSICNDMVLCNGLTRCVATAATGDINNINRARFNARLIAAAPELYEALREIYENSNPMCNMECHECKHKYGCNKWVVKARAALEKAGGAE